MHTDHLLFSIAQVVIARHNERAGLPLVEHTSNKDGVPNPSNKIMIFVPGVPQTRQLHDMLRRALDLGWTWGLIPLEFHGLSNKQSNDDVLTGDTLGRFKGYIPCLRSAQRSAGGFCLQWWELPKGLGNPSNPLALGHSALSWPSVCTKVHPFAGWAG